MKELTRLWALSGILFGLLLAMVGVSSAQKESLAEARTYLSAAYQRALYESDELLSGMQLGTRKLLVSGSAERSQALLSEIVKQAEGVGTNLSTLPLGEATTAPILKFVNQTGDFCRVLGDRLASGDSVSDDDLLQIAGLSAGLATARNEVLALISDFESGELVLSVTAPPEDGSADSQPAVSYPVLLYDGPFSDTAVSGSYRGLTGDEVSEADAETALVRFFGADKVSDIRFEQETAIPVPCYEYSLVMKGRTLSAAVTKTGGHVLYALSESYEAAPALSRDACRERAASFLKERGFGEVSADYDLLGSGILTVNCVPVANGVLLYPDLVKVQVSMADGEIIGFESSRYYANHTDRTALTPRLSESAARAKVSGALTLSDVRLCVAPIETGEALCYEYRGQLDGDETFLIYIDANTGRERAIMRLQDAGDGIVAQ